MINRAEELCRKLKPVLGQKIDRIWSVYLAESDPAEKRELEQVLELLAAKHLRQDYQPNRNPFPPPSEAFAQSGNLELGDIFYADKPLYPFKLKSRRLKEHILIAGRSGSGKTNLTFVLMQAMMQHGIKVLALDWKRGYRDLMQTHKELQVYTIGRDIAPFRFNPLIPPVGCEPQVWIKLIVDVIGNAYLGGEGVISLLVAGLDHLFREAGVYDGMQTHWPTVQDLLIWLRKTKLKGRAALWQASAERILLAMTYGEFSAVINTQNNTHLVELLNHNVVLEMDGLSSNTDRNMFSEALTLYLYRVRLAQGPCQELTNIIILEEAHNLLHRKSAETMESVLENSIRMVRQYGLGYVFVDQSASLLSQVAFANSYATLAMSQKLKADIQTISGAMNLTDEQKQALNTLAIGTAIVRLADEYPEPFLIKVPLCPVQEGFVTDDLIRKQNRTYPGDSPMNRTSPLPNQVISAIPDPDNNQEIEPNNTYSYLNTHPPSPYDHEGYAFKDQPPGKKISRDEIRFLADVAAYPLATTVTRYQRLNLSRRRGNAIRQGLAQSGIIEAVSMATRSGQVMLYQLTDIGRRVCEYIHIDPGSPTHESLEHRYWVRQVARHYEQMGYDIQYEHPVKGREAVDLVATKGGRRMALEVETGKSDIKANIAKMKDADFDEIILVATSSAAISACQKAVENIHPKTIPHVELLTWLDMD